MYDILTIGTGTRDVFLESALFRVVRDPEHLTRIGFPTGEAQCFALGGKVEVNAPTLTVGGGAANAAVTFARHGLKTLALMALGHDENGKAVLGAMKNEDIATLPLFDKKEMTAYSVILLSSGERTILTYRGASEHFPGILPWTKLQARASYIVPGKISLSVMQKIVAHLKSGNTLIAMNPSKHYIEMGAKKLAPLLNALAVVIMNREEASYLTGVDYADVHGIFRKLDALIRGIAVMTDGPRGVWISDGAHLYRAGIFKEKKLVDRTGAGDAFGSGFVAALMHGRSSDKNEADAEDIRFSKSEIEYAIRFASANATAVVEVIGAEPGILTSADFAREKRFNHLPIEIQTL